MWTRRIRIWIVFMVHFGRTGVAPPNLLEISIYWTISMAMTNGDCAEWRQARGSSLQFIIVMVSITATFSMALGIAFSSTVKILFSNDSRTEVNLASVVKTLLLMLIWQSQTQFLDAPSYFTSSIFRETRTPWYQLPHFFATICRHVIIFHCVLADRTFWVTSTFHSIH